jgi:hypothetical protein
MNQQPYSVKVSHTFSGVRLDDGYLTSAQWGVRLEVQANGSTEELANVAIAKVQHFFDICLANVLMVDIKDRQSINVVNHTDNPFMLLPGSPTDDMVSRLLFLKLAKIIGNDLSIVSLELTASDHAVEYLIVDEITEGLPANTTDFVGDNMLSLHTTPWWFRPDGFTTELLVEAGGESTPQEMYAEVEDPMQAFVEYLMEDTDDDPEPPKKKKSARIEKFNKWNPKRV